MKSRGSSPRGRGTDALSAPHTERDRFIPAWAGNRAPYRVAFARHTVHPRVGGEQGAAFWLKAWHAGSSPRGRGTVGLPRAPIGIARFIPAWAGNSATRGHHQGARSVHPRVGGEQSAPFSSDNLSRGSSPRGRGTGRHDRGDRPAHRFIPAWAGNRLASLPDSVRTAVHPRVGGEQRVGQPRHLRHSGSSPRGRGTEVPDAHRHGKLRFIPAWAGNRPASWLDGLERAVHPRVGGEQQRQPKRRRAPVGSSPRGRGTDFSAKLSALLDRFIPAWAGNRRDARVAAAVPEVHPRVGGEQPS